VNLPVDECACFFAGLREISGNPQFLADGEKYESYARDRTDECSRSRSSRSEDNAHED
jgi:hypothetical protein